MSYLVQSQIPDDGTLLRRVAACAATEDVKGALDWAVERAWALSAQPGWVGAYASAIAAGDDDPGANESAVTDGMILAAVQALLGVVPPEPDPDESEPEPEPEEPDPDIEPDPDANEPDPEDPDPAE